MAKVFYITGIDTGIGKTYAAGVLAAFLQQQGHRVITAKLVQTGCKGISEDIILHRKIMGIDLLPEDISGITCPYVFTLPASPHLAARAEEKAINPEVILNSISRLAEMYDFIIVEGAGGLLVPLTGDLMAIDFAAAQNWPIIIVSSSRLGSINHTLMTVECAASRNCMIAGVIYNTNSPDDPAITADSRDIIEANLNHFSDRASLVDLPQIDITNIPDIDFSDIFV